MIKAFTWVGNTGKSYCIQKESWIKYKEIAREYLHLFWDDMTPVQKIILDAEKDRLFDLMTYTGKEDIVIDRTFVDNLVYLYYNMIKWKFKWEFDFGELAEYIQQSYELYDEVVLFTEPLKIDKRYDDPKLNELMISTIKTVYWDKVKVYKNSKDYLDNK